MARTVIETETSTVGNVQKMVGRWYDDGAYNSRLIDIATGKTIHTSFNTGRGHRFSRGFGSEWYKNGNNIRMRDLQTGEVHYFHNGHLRYSILRSGDAN